MNKLLEWAGIGGDDDSPVIEFADQRRRAESAQLQAALRREKDAAAVARLEHERWVAQVESTVAAVDADALEAAQRAVDAAIDELDRITAMLAGQRDKVAKLEAKSAAALSDASLDELAKLASGKSAVADELRSARLVAEELERRQQSARRSVDVARGEYGRVRTAGLAALADQMVGEIVDDADLLAGKLRELVKVQQLIAYYGGSAAGRLAGAQATAMKLQAMVNAHRGGGRDGGAVG